MRFNKAVSAAAVVALAGCSNLQEAPGPEFIERFHTEVTGQELQQFTYSLRRPGTGGGEPGIVSRRAPAGDKRDAGGGSRKERERFARQVTVWMERQLNASGFCRHGYFIIDRDILPGAAEIRGECKSVNEDGGQQPGVVEQ